MASSKQPERKKKTKEEIKQTRNKLIARQQNTDRKQIIDLRKDRHGIQNALAEIVTEVKNLHEFIGSEEVKKNVPEEVILRCKQAIGSFKKDVDEQKETVKETIKELTSMEEQVLNKQAAIDDVVLPYNLTAAPLMDTVLSLTQKGADTLMSCTEELSKYTQKDDTKATEVNES